MKCHLFKTCRGEKGTHCNMPHDDFTPYCFQRGATATRKPTPFGLLERFVKWLKVLFCRHDWEYGESGSNMPEYRWCKKCEQKQQYIADGGCHGEAWWQNVAI